MKTLLHYDRRTFTEKFESCKLPKIKQQQEISSHAKWLKNWQEKNRQCADVKDNSRNSKKSFGRIKKSRRWLYNSQNPICQVEKQ